MKQFQARRIRKFLQIFYYKQELTTGRFLVSSLKCFGSVNKYFYIIQINIFCQYAEEPFLEALRVTLDERYTAQMDVIYHVLARYIIQTLVDGYNK